MKITATKVKRELIKKGWGEDIMRHATNSLLISDVLKIIDDILIEQKNISIRK